MPEEFVCALGYVVSYLGIFFQGTESFIIDIFGIEMVDKFEEVFAPSEEIAKSLLPQRLTGKRRQRLNRLMEEPDCVSKFDINKIGIFLSRYEVNEFINSKKVR